MAIRASATITLSQVVDIESTTRYYLLQSSTLAKPAKPTANPPAGGWDDTEPTYTSGSTNSLYTVDLTVYSDGTWAYSAVSLSSSYEAAKEAYNKALAAQQAAQAAQDAANAALIYDSAEPPETALAEGKLWLDRGVSPAVLRRWLGHEVSPDRSHAGSAEGNPVILQGVGRIESFDSITTRFSPVQAGEGDPYPAGGGRNLLNPSEAIAKGNFEHYGVTGTWRDDGDLVLNGTLTGDAWQSIGVTMVTAGNTYTVSVGGNAWVAIWDRIANVYVASAKPGITATFVAANTGAYAYAFESRAGVAFSDERVKLMVNEGSEALPWEPSINIRPITGCDALELNHVGKNLCPFMIKGETFSMNGMTAEVTDEGMIVNGTPSAAYASLAYQDLELPAGTYTISGGNTSSDVYFQIFVRDADDNVSHYVDTVFTVKGTEKRICAYIQNGAKTPSMTNYVLKAQLELGSTATSFELCQSTPYAVQIGQTIYGGTMDWLTGKLTTRWKLRKLTSGYTWNYTTGSGNELFYLGLSEGSIIGHGASGFLCSHYPTGESIWTQESARGSVVNTNSDKFQPGFVFAEGAFGSVDAWTAFLDAQNAAGTPVQIAYPVTEPTEIQLVPAQISPLEGVNTLFGDGDAIALSYAASGWEIVNDVQTIKSALDQVRETANNAVSRAEQQQYMRLEPDGLYVGLLDRNGGRTRVTFQSFDVIRADGYVSASLGDARQDIGSMTLYSTAEGHTAFVPREV